MIAAPIVHTHDCDPAERTATSCPCGRLDAYREWCDGVAAYHEQQHRDDRDAA